MMCSWERHQSAIAVAKDADWITVPYSDLSHAVYEEKVKVKGGRAGAAVSENSLGGAGLTL